MKTAIFATLCFVTTLPTFAQESRTWEGKWGNRKYGTSGPLKCVAAESKPGMWNAAFSGSFKGSPFNFKVAFSGKPSRQGSSLGGQATIGGSRYQWSGSIQGRQLKGSYKALNGNYGEFTLNETGTAKRTQNPGNKPRTARPEVNGGSSGKQEYEIANGDHLLFIGNSFMANEGGVQNYLAAALQKKRIKIETDKHIYYGQPLANMAKPEAQRSIESGDYKAVVITSGRLDVMKNFDAGIRKAGMKTVVMMTWELRHPGNRSTTTYYTESTKKVVQDMRAMEKQTGAIIVPTAVVFHDLTVRPPAGMPRVDYLWKPRNIHQNELGALVNSWMLYTILTGNTPVGVNFDLAPYVVGQKLRSNSDIRLTRDLRTALQERVWKVAQAWKAGKSHLE
jgi:hypothetical protein